MKRRNRFPSLLKAAAVFAVLSSVAVLAPCSHSQTKADASGDVTPERLLSQVRDHYHGLNTFSMTIEHRDSSGLFPGEYRQTLQWKKSGQFALLVSSTSETKAPNYYADVDSVVTRFRDGKQSVDPTGPRPNFSPGWEVSGGMILGFLQRTPVSDFWFKPPAGVKFTYAFGTRKIWHGHKVREIVVTIDRDPKMPGMLVSLFVDATQPVLTGFEWNGNGKVGYAIYSEQNLNPTLPADLGNQPKASDVH